MLAFISAPLFTLLGLSMAAPSGNTIDIKSIATPVETDLFQIRNHLISVAPELRKLGSGTASLSDLYTIGSTFLPDVKAVMSLFNSENIQLVKSFIDSYSPEEIKALTPELFSLLNAANSVISELNSVAGTHN